MARIHDADIIGDIEIFGATSGSITLDAASVTTSYSLIFPAADAAGALTSDGSGNLSFVVPSTAAADEVVDADNDTQIQVEEAADEDIIRFDTGDSPAGYGAVANILTIASSGFTLAMGTANTATTAGAPISLTSGTGNTTGDGGDITLVAGDGGTAGLGGDINITSGDAGTGSGDTGGNVNITLGAGDGAGADGEVVITSPSTDPAEVRLEDNGGDYVGLAANANVTTSYTLAFPAADAAGSLVSDGSGQLTFGGMVQSAYAENRSHQDITATFPKDDTIPQQTEGTEVVTVTITPKSSTNILEITGYIVAQASAQQYHALALFQDSTADALEAVCFAEAGSNFGHVIPIHHRMTAGTTSATTFKLRAGPAAGNLYLNGPSTGRALGGTAKSFIEVKEYAS